MLYELSLEFVSSTLVQLSLNHPPLSAIINSNSTLFTKDSVYSRLDGGTNLSENRLT